MERPGQSPPQEGSKRDDWPFKNGSNDQASGPSDKHTLVQTIPRFFNCGRSWPLRAKSILVKVGLKSVNGTHLLARR